MPANLTQRLAVYLVLDPDLCLLDPLETVGGALEGGVTCVQLRAKNRTDRLFFDLAAAIREATLAHTALFIVNDRLDIALAAAADGVHLGVDDLPVSEARRISPDRFVIGFSADSDEAADRAIVDGADYLGVGPVFGTRSKADAGGAIGLDALRRRVATTSVPIVGIGGIDVENAAAVIAAGACGVAVISAIAGTADPRSAAEQLRRRVEIEQGR